MQIKFSPYSKHVLGQYMLTLYIQRVIKIRGL